MALPWALAALTVMLSITLGWRHRASALAGAGAGVALLFLGGLLGPSDLRATAVVLWRPLLTITSVMLMTACARHVGLFAALAELVEPTTRGPVRRAFRLVFVISALTASLLSNDAAILVLTPTVITLLRTVYPRRHPKFTLAFSFAVFYSAGVAPLVTGNPMNVVVASHAGIGFNAYALTMVPVAVVGWLVAYPLLARQFALELADEAPALGAWPSAPARLGARGMVVVLAMAAVLAAYPVISYFDGPLWMVATIGAVVCVLTAMQVPVGADPTAVASTHGAATPSALRVIAGETSWELLPFLAAVLLVASGLAKAGLADALAEVLRASPAPLPTMGLLSAAGAAAINNHPMAMLGSMAVSQLGHGAEANALTLAGLVGGDLGPRLLPIGSLAGLLWIGALRRHGVELTVRRFIHIGVVVTVPSLLASLATLWLMTYLTR
ncbi:MAG: hypothetical protein IPI49_01175 [Myxococcales bacterium]|nr:hypothetical protein [Myxococcales bacterium]